MERFIFDVDGTLTPSRQTIDSDFAVFFKNFCRENHVYLITGSDKQKTIEQVGEQIYNLAKRVYNCSGSDVWEKDQNIRRDNWIIPQRASEFLQSISKKFNKLFTELEATVGGETGIDIAPKGANKSQIIKDFDQNDTLHFFGDAMNTHGNDYPLKQVIIDQARGSCYAVSNWKDTKNILYERTLGRKISS